MTIGTLLSLGPPALVIAGTLFLTMLAYFSNADVWRFVPLILSASLFLSLPPLADLAMGCGYYGNYPADVWSCRYAWAVIPTFFAACGLFLYFIYPWVGE